MVRGEAYFVDENSLRVMDEKSAQTYNFKNAIIATGSRPIEIPNFEFGKRVIDSTGALKLQEVPGKLEVVGGGYIGSELGTAFANFGSEIKILESAKEILGGFEKQKVQPVKKGMKEKGIEIITKAMAKNAEETENGVKVTYEAKGEEKTIEADYVLVTVGRRPTSAAIGLDQAVVTVTARGLAEVDNQSRSMVYTILAIGYTVPGVTLANEATSEVQTLDKQMVDANSAKKHTALP
ncbi:dihydrolipoyl dehydrogenase, partial [Listeria monocytogenes]